jgi:predicted nucleic acid-binding protein
MADDIFVDTSGFLLVKKDDRHAAASRMLRHARKRQRRFVTSDYVLDETATLLKARGHGHLLPTFFEKVLASQACRIEWTDQNVFMKCKHSSSSTPISPGRSPIASASASCGKRGCTTP